MNRSFETACLKTGLLAAAIAASIPGALMAENSCNAFLEATTANSVFNINEPVGIVLEIGAGIVVDDPGDGSPTSPGWLDIFGFQYQLDCTEGDTYPTCNAGGNTVEFVPASIDATDCEGPAGEDVYFDFSTYTVGDAVVDFIPEDINGTPIAIRNDSEATCLISFDVVVTDLNAANLDEEVVELTGWVNPSPEETFGLCSNGLVAAAASSVSFDFSTNFANFRVTKDYDPDPKLPTDTEMRIRCNAGLPLQNSYPMGEDGVVTFTVTAFEPGTLNCDIWEEPIPSGYVPDYTADRINGVGDFTDDADGCYFTNVGSGNFSCDVINTRAPGSFTATKIWDYDEDMVDFDIDENVTITIWCDSPILNGQQEDTNLWSVSDVVGHEGFVTAYLDPDDGTAYCWAEEEVAQPDVVASSDDCDIQKVLVGSEVECTFYNTIVFEGIPTLNQYGLALMALLMMGLGFFGFRRLI